MPKHSDIVGVGCNREEAREDAWRQARAKGLVILTTGDHTYEMGEWGAPDVYTLEVTTVKPGWLMRDVKKAAKRARMWAAQPKRK